METRCCDNPEHTCFRKRGQRGSPYGYAVCMTSCPQDDEWDCEEITLSPPAPPMDVSEPTAAAQITQRQDVSMCSERFTACLESQCCKSEYDGCFHRIGRQFAMCKPLRPYVMTGACVSDSTWECPGWEVPPPSATSPPWPPVPNVDLSQLEDEPDMIGDFGSGSFRPEPRSEPNRAVVPPPPPRREPRFETKLQVAFVFASLMLCCLGLLIAVTKLCLRCCLRRARVKPGATTKGPAAANRMAKRIGVVGNSRAKYTRQTSLNNDDEMEDVEDDAVDEDQDAVALAEEQGASRTRPSI